MLESRFKNTSQGVALAQILPVVSLFSGSGSLDEGFIQAGFSLVLAMDIDRAACQTFYWNHHRVRILKKDLSQPVNGHVVERLTELPSAVRPIGVIDCQHYID